MSEDEGAYDMLQEGAGELLNELNPEAGAVWDTANHVAEFGGAIADGDAQAGFMGGLHLVEDGLSEFGGPWGEAASLGLQLGEAGASLIEDPLDDLFGFHGSKTVEMDPYQAAIRDSMSATAKATGKVVKYVNGSPTLVDP